MAKDLIYECIIGVLAIIGFIWVLTSTMKGIVNIIDKILEK
jgi:hypothetical protein